MQMPKKLDVYERILRFLGEKAEPLSLSQLQAGVSANARTVKACLKKLIADGLVRGVIRLSESTAFYELIPSEEFVPKTVDRPKSDKMTAQQVWAALTPAERAVRQNFASLICGHPNHAPALAKEPLHFSVFFAAGGAAGFVITHQFDGTTIAVTILLNEEKRIRSIVFAAASRIGGTGGAYYARRSGFRNAGLKAKKDYRAVLKAHLGDDMVR